MYIHVSRWHTFYLGSKSSLSATRWYRWDSGRKWHPFWCRLFQSIWWRFTSACAPEACLWILCCSILQERQPSVWFSWTIAGCLSITAFTLLCPENSTPCFFSSQTLDWGFLIRFCIASIVVQEKRPLAILAIFKGRRMLDGSSCTRPCCIAIMADMLNTYKKSVAASTYEIQLLPLPYTLLEHPLWCSKPGFHTLGDTYHETCLQNAQSWQYHNVRFRRTRGWLPSLAMEVSDYRQLWIGEVAPYVHQMYNQLLVDTRLPPYGWLTSPHMLFLIVAASIFTDHFEMCIMGHIFSDCIGSVVVH